MNVQTDNQKRSIFGRFSFWVAIVAVGLVITFSYATINTRFNESPLSNLPVYEVQQGPFLVSIDVSGTIQAREKVILKSEIEGQSTILFIIPEGQRVKKDDLLVELDVSSLADSLIDQQIRMQNAEATFINSRENFEIVKNQAQSDIDQAQLLFDFAKQDLRKYLEGEFPKLQKTAETDITLREQTLNQAEYKLKWSKILFEEKYLSQTELMADEKAEVESKLRLELAKADLALLNEFTYQREIAQLTSDVTQTEMALERDQRKANANIVQASADLQATQSQYNREISKLKKLEEQISKAKIYAPMDGLVVYASSAERGRSFRSSNEPLEEGTTVRERQNLIHLPTTSSFIAEVKVHETILDKIRLNLPVRITIDALPGQSFTGRVDKIAPLPDAQSAWMNPDLKVYNTDILIEGNGDELRSGMSCQAEIIVDQFKDTIYIPVQAVLLIGDQPTVYVANANQLEPRSVELGPDNNRRVQIKSGLKKGEIVVLTPPLSEAEAPENELLGDEFDIPDNPVETGQAAPQGRPGQGDPSMQGGGRPQAPGMGGERGGGRRGGPGGERGGRGQGQSPGMGEGRGGGSRPSGEFGGGGRRGGGQNMTEEQREAMRQRFQNMSEEEREEMRSRFQNRSGQQGGEQQGQQRSPGMGESRGGGSRPSGGERGGSGQGRPDSQNKSGQQASEPQSQPQSSGDGGSQ